MKSRGYTLIELLGVMIILALLIMLVVPFAINSIESSQNKKDDYTKELILNAADLYMKNNLNEFDKVEGNVYCIDLDILVSTDYLNGPLYLSKNNDEDITNLMSVKASYTEDFNLEIVNKEACVQFEIGDTDDDEDDNEDDDTTGDTETGESGSTTTCTYTKNPSNYICTPATSETVTVGNIPTGAYQAGDEYICNVNDTLSYSFFVLSKEDINSDGCIDQIALILDRNITENSLWKYSAKTTKDGPTIILSRLTLESWTKVPNVVINYKDEGNNYKTIKTVGATTTLTSSTGVTTSYQNLKARLPKLSEIKDAGCLTTNFSCPIWLSNYLSLSEAFCSSNSKYCNDYMTNKSTAMGYWLLSSKEKDTTYSSIYTVGGYAKLGIYATTAGSDYGTRPVITIPITDMP